MQRAAGFRKMRGIVLAGALVAVGAAAVAGVGYYGLSDAPIAAPQVAATPAAAPEPARATEPVLANARALATAMQSHGYQIVSGGTDNHLMLVDLRSKGLTGKVAEEALDKAGITVNKNTVPKETQSPFVTSGIRIGTPAVTTRGMGVAEMTEIARLINTVLVAPADTAVHAKVRAEVRTLTARFPLYRPA